MTREIPLSQNKVALVDDADFLDLSRHRWCAVNMNGYWYAVRAINAGPNRQKTVYIHRQVLDEHRLDKMIDHHDGDGLNNQRHNLRIVDRSGNMRNQRRTSGSSRFKGVSWHRKQEKWGANIYLEGKNRWLGTFDSEVDAARAYDEAATRFYGEHAATNLEMGRFQ